MLMLQSVMRPSIESARHRVTRILDYVSRCAVRADLSDDSECEIFRRHAFGKPPRTSIFIVSALLRQALRRQHMLDLAGADPECQSTKRAMRACMAIAADDRHAGLRQTDSGPITCTIPCSGELMSNN